MIQVKGQINQIYYRNDSNGYTVGTIKEEKTNNVITIVGNFVALREGEFVQLEGEWTSHPKYGRQLKIATCTQITPKGSKGIELYLAAGFVTGIGPELAKRIVQKFGDKTLDIFDNNINRLKEISGIANKKLEMIRVSYEAEKKLRALVFFLQENSIQGTLATKIYELYGERSIDTIKENPYVLVKDISGVGFVTADNIAKKMGFPLESVFRAEAAIYHTLQVYANDGHSYCPTQELINKANDLIHIDEEYLINGIDRLQTNYKIINTVEFGEERTYITYFYNTEKESANCLKKLIKTKSNIKQIPIDEEIKSLESSTMQLADEQKQAIQTSFKEKVLIITGGPGVGKTTIVNSIIDIYTKNSLGQVLLAAPTGKAAKRMAEVTGMEAKTIHRLLEYDSRTHGFIRGKDFPLTCDLLICDEASMIDISLFNSLIKAVPERATLILVGDVNQLPSVGVGNVLNDIIKSEMIPVIRLTKIFRQAEQSLIIVNSHRINNGENILTDKTKGTDFLYLEKSDPENICDTIIELVTEKIPAKFNYDPLNDIQVLAPMYKGETGVNTLNTKLQKSLNPSSKSNGINRGMAIFAIGDKVMQIRNNYDKEVFNGDIGAITQINHDTKELLINIDGRNITYSFSELDELVLAYATTVHKSQGSEYPVVVIPLTMQHYMLLQRNLLYTGVTRGKKLVVIVGEKKALATAIRNNKTRHRYTSLTEMMVS